MIIMVNIVKVDLSSKVAAVMCRINIIMVTDLYTIMKTAVVS